MTDLDEKIAQVACGQMAKEALICEVVGYKREVFGIEGKCPSCGSRVNTEAPNICKALAQGKQVIADCMPCGSALMIVEKPERKILTLNEATRIALPGKVNGS